MMACKRDVDKPFNMVRYSANLLASCALATKSPFSMQPSKSRPAALICSFNSLGDSDWSAWYSKSFLASRALAIKSRFSVQPSKSRPAVLISSFNSVFDDD